MAQTFAAIKGKFGDTEYFLLAMKAEQLVEKAHIPATTLEWKDMSLEEREQRDINYNRIKKQIVPYLQKDKSRFFGALILTAQNLKTTNFEPLNKFAAELPKLYEEEAHQVGFLTLKGNEILVPLDGEHRLIAIQMAISGQDEKGKKIDGGPDFTLADEDVTIILVPYDKMKARKIFTKVNRYAKPTSKGQNLVTDDEDIIAILARYIANKIIGADLVNYKSNTLSKVANRNNRRPSDARYFTTLATIADCNEAILNVVVGGKIDRTKPVEDADKDFYIKEVQEVWDFLVKNIELLADALRDKSETGDQRRIEIRRNYLLGKPIVQLCLVKAFMRLITKDGMEKSQATAKLNKIDWRNDVPVWNRLLISGGKVQKQNKELAVDIICYMAGEGLDKEEEMDLLSRYRKLFPENEAKIKELPSPIGELVARIRKTTLQRDSLFI